MFSSNVKNKEGGKGGEGRERSGQRAYILRLDADDAATMEEPSCRVLMSTTRDIVRRFKLSISDPTTSCLGLHIRDIHAAGSDCSPRMWQICLVRRGTRIYRCIHPRRTRPRSSSPDIPWRGTLIREDLGRKSLPQKLFAFDWSSIDSYSNRKCVGYYWN